MNNYSLVIFGLLLQFLSCLLFIKDKFRLSLLVLIIAGVVLRIYFINFDSFLHDWDEKYHALVAKNLSQHFLLPTLIENPLLPFDKTGWWGENHIWLHKQPLFLWQMALSIKMFGASVFAVRLPSLVMSSLLILVLFDIGRNMVNIYIGFLSAFIFTCYEPILQLCSGLAGMDHNDIAFLFYVTLSLWAWVKYEKSKNIKWIILMGGFSGAAILNKWLTGLMVFIAFGFFHLFFERDFFSKSIVRALLIGIISCVLVAIPWQIFIITHYPQEALFEYRYNSLHFSQVLEGHNHSIWYYFTILKEQYKLLRVFILVGLMIVLLNSKKYKLLISAFAMALFVFLFFSIAKTKLPSYTIVLTPILIVFLSLGINSVIQWSKRLGKYSILIQSLIFFLVMISYFDFPRVNEYFYTKDNWVGVSRTKKIKELQEYKTIKGRLPRNSVIINFPEFNSIEARFFTNYDCYGWITEENKQKLRDSGRIIYSYPDEFQKR